MTTYQINATYYAGTSVNVEFPEGKTWDDVEHCSINWDTLHIRWKSGGDWNHPLGSDISDCVDWKRPLSATVHPVNEDTDETDYDVEVATL